jgi:hypothetical protein
MSISVAWRTEHMPAAAFKTYHDQCYRGQDNDLHRTQYVRRVQTSKVARSATCCECGGNVHESPRGED